MAVRIFFSYSHKDERFKETLEAHLSVLQRNGYIETWDDRKIAPGSGWREDINMNLEKTKIFLPLVSEYFLASDYCYETETIFALEQHAKKKCIIIPIIIKPCLFSRSNLSHLQALPKNVKPVTQWKDRGAAWLNVAEGIIKVIEDNPQIMNERDYSHITFGPSVIAKSGSKSPSLEHLLIQFLTAYSSWYFSPLRIQKWGNKQSGFESLNNFTVEKIRSELKRMSKEGKVKTTRSKKGNTLFKLS